MVDLKHHFFSLNYYKKISQNVSKKLLFIHYTGNFLYYERSLRNKVNTALQNKQSLVGDNYFFDTVRISVNTYYRILYIPDTYVLLKLLLSSFLAIYRKIEIAPAFLMYDLNGKNSTTS